MKKHISKYFFLLLSLLNFQVVKAQDVLVLDGGTITIDAGARLYVEGGIRFEPGSKLEDDGEVNIATNSGSGTEDWTDNTTLGAMTSGSTGLVEFSSTDGHEFTGKTQFYDVNMNALGGLHLNDNFETKDNLLFTTGIIKTDSKRVYVSTTAANAVVADGSNPLYANSWVSGNLRRDFTSNTSTYDFPVGDSASSELFQLINNNFSGISQFDAKFGYKWGNDVGMTASENGTNYVYLNPRGVWFIQPDALTTGGDFNGKFYLNGFINTWDNQFGILQRGIAATSGGNWEVPPGSAMPPNGGSGRLVADGFNLRFNIDTLGQFGLGQTGAPLPVTLTAFKGFKNENKNTLNWTTSAENNLKTFVVERANSLYGNFADIGAVNAKGFSTVQNNYVLDDVNPFAGNNYYRLRMIDADGKYKYSAVVLINNAVTASVFVSPNPAKNNFTVQLSGYNKVVVSFTLISASGVVVLSKSINTSVDGNSIPFDLKNIAAGNYILRITSGGNITEQKIVVQ